MALSAQIQITDQDINSVSSTQGGEYLGQIARTVDGRTWVYALNGSASVALSPGKLTQGAVSTANHVNRSFTTYTAGTTQVSVTVGATAVTANQYAGGYLVVNAGTGAGQALLIDGNTACNSSGTTTVNLADGILVATATSDSKVSLMPNPYSALLISDHTAATSVIPTGVPTVSVAASSYGWFQTGGPAAVLANGTPGAGVAVIPGATTDGSVDIATGAITQPFVGYMLIAAVSTEYRECFLTINPM